MSRPKQSGGRVTATEKIMIARSRLSPTKEVTGGCQAHCTHVFADEWSVRGFMRSRSRPQRPRTGSPNVVRSAGTGQRRSTKCRRGGPVAAQRSSGLPRRQGGSPSGADGRGCQAAGGAERSPDPTDDGTREGGRGRTERQAVHQAGRERRRSATPATVTPAAYR